MNAKISLIDEKTKKPINGFVNVRATDKKPFLELEKKKLPPSLPTMILLENEVLKNNPECELYDSNQYIDYYFDKTTKPEKTTLRKTILIQFS